MDIFDPKISPPPQVVTTFGAASGLATISLPASQLVIQPAPSILNVDAQQENLPTSRNISFRGSAENWRVIYGEARAGGAMTFIRADEETDEDAHGEWLHFIHTLAAHKINDVTKLYINNEEVVFGGGSYHTDPRWGADGTKWNNIIFMSETLGADDQASNADLLAQSNALFPGVWTADHRQRGHAYVYHIFQFNPVAFPDGWPRIEYLVEGKADVYDPRDTTYKYTKNAALIIADYLCNSRWGCKVDYATGIDEANLIEAANICDESVSLNGGGSEARYEINAVIDTSLSPRRIREQMATAIAGPIVWTEGKWKIFPGKWRTPSITLTEKDVRSELKIETKSSKNNAFNAVRGTYYSPSADYQLTDYPSVRNGTYENEDGGEILWRDITMPLVVSSAACQRIGKIYLEDNRQDIVVEGTFGLAALKLQVEDNIYFTLDRLGWSSKEFRVVQKKPIAVSSGDSLEIQVELTLKETASGIYDWNSGEETVVDLAPNSSLPDLSVVTDPTGLVLESGTEHLYTRVDGTVFSRIYVSWDTVTDPYVNPGGQIEIQCKRSADSTWGSVSIVSGDVGFFYILDVEDGVEYDVRIRNVNSVSNKSNWLTQSNHFVVGKTAPPSNVENLFETINSYGIRLQWDAIPDKDLSHYLINVGDNRQNAAYYSEELESPNWAQTRATVATNQAANPINGAVDADELIENTSASNTHYNTGSTAIESGKQYRIGVYAKRASGTRNLRIRCNIAGAVTYVQYDLGALSISATSGTIDDSGIEDVGNGWVLCWFEATSDTDDPTLVLYLVNGTSNTYTGDGSSSLYLWGAHIYETSATNKTYVKSQGSAITPGSTTLLDEVKSTSYLWEIQDSDEYHFSVRAVDTSGNESETDATVTATIVDPGTPVPTSSFDGPDVVLSWTEIEEAMNGFAIDAYEISYGATYPGTPVNETKATEFRVRVTWGSSRKFWIVTRDVAGNRSSPASVDVDIVAPSAVQNFISEVVDNNINLRWTAPSAGSLPIETYCIYKGSIFASAELRGCITGTFKTFFELLKGTYTYWITAKDTAGNESTEVSVQALVNSPPDYVLTDDATMYGQWENSSSGVLIGVSAEDQFASFNPNDFGDCQLWLKADAGVTKNGSDLVELWEDQSGSGNHVEQTTEANRPTWIDDLANGLPGIDFDGVDNFLERANALELEQPTVLIVFESNLDASIHYMLGAGDVTAEGWYMYCQSDGDCHFVIGDGTTNEDANNQTVITADTVEIAIGRYDLVNVLSRHVDQSEVVTEQTHAETDAIDYTGITNFRIGSLNAHSGTRYLDGRVYEVLVFDEALSDANIKRIQNYLQWRWMPRADRYDETQATGTAIVPVTVGASLDDKMVRVCADLERNNTEFLNRSSGSVSSSVVFNDQDFFGAVWFTPESVNVQQSIFGHYNYTTNNRSWLLEVLSNGVAQLRVSQDGVSYDTVVASSHGALSAGVPYFIAFGHRQGTDIWIEIDRGTRDTLSHTSGVHNATANLEIGATEGGLTADGKIGPTCLVAIDPSSALLNELYNSGIPRNLAGLPATYRAEFDGTNQDGSYWNMTETSGTRVDSGAAGNDLTDNNTVLSGEVTVATSLQDLIDAGYTYILMPSADLAQQQWIIDYGTVLPATLISLTYQKTTIAGGVTISTQIDYSTDGSSWTSGAANATQILASSFRFIRITFSAVPDDDKSLAQLENIRVRLDVKKSGESGKFTANAGDASGTEVAFVKNWIDVQNITVTPWTNAQLDTAVEFTDTPNPTSFFVRIWDQSGTRQTVDCGYEVKGIEDIDDA